MSDLIDEKGADLLKKQESVQHGYILAPIDDLIENTWNPNKMDAVDFEKLKSSLEKDWGNKNGPIFTRPHPTQKGKYEIVDGAHRRRAMKDMGFEEIVIVVEDLDTPSAMLRTLWFNKHRGTFDNVLLAGVIHDLKTTYNLSDEEINDALGYTSEEIKGLETLVDFDFSKYEEENKLDIKDEWVLVPETFTVQMKPEQLQQLESLLARINMKDKGKALLMCAKYLSDQLANGECDEATLDSLSWRVDSLGSLWEIITDDDKAASLIPDEEVDF